MPLFMQFHINRVRFNRSYLGLCGKVLARDLLENTN